ncbi:MAG: cupin domain-containing protein [Deltaproteobacteria bacterium]|nr:cupin domain-containing protein [Deltaproteobacteria bacterium]
MAEIVAVDLVNHVQYADGSVVSKTLVDKKTGTVTLFAFDAGQGLSEHTAPFDAVVQILDGEARLVVGGVEVAAPAGRLVVMPAHVPHSVKAEQRFKMMLIMIRS